MKKPWLLAGILILGVVFLWLFVGRERHPDTSSVARFAPYAEIGGDIAPSWSPDDKELTYCRYSQPGPQEEEKLYVVPANGGTPKLFLSGPQPRWRWTPKSEGCFPAWSPDGMRVAFSSNRSGKFQLMTALGLEHPLNVWTAGGNGSDLRQVTNLRANALDPVWSPDGKQIAFTAFPDPHVMTVSASGGEAMVFANGLSPAWSPDGRRMAYFSGESGQTWDPPFSIFVQPAKGGAPKRLRSLVIKSTIYYRPGLDWSPDGQRLVAVHPENGQWEAVVINETEDRIESTLPIAGSVVSPRWSHDGKRIAYRFTDTGHPSNIEVLTLASGERTQLTHGSIYTTAQLIRYKSGGDLEIPSWLYLPRDSDLAKHPALVWLHGGAPGLGWTSNQFDPHIQYFVDQGFVVLAPNYRGSAGFGDQLARFRQGDDIVPDIAAGVNYLKRLESVDAAHIGVVGFSFGGFLTLRSITQQPELFAAAVDFFGISDLVRYYQEDPPTRSTLSGLLGGTPEQNPEAYRAASPVNFVDRVKAPLLILHGTADDSVRYSQSVELVEALKREHKNYEFITYRSAGHDFSGKDDIDANQQVMRFLLAHLKASPS